jgi:hypothetical protein
MSADFGPETLESCRFWPKIRDKRKRNQNARCAERKDATSCHISLFTADYRLRLGASVELGLMLTAAAAEREISELTGTLPARVARTARALREARQGLYSEGKPGGGVNGNRPQLGHLVNLLLGLAVADPATAPSLVLGFRSLNLHPFDPSVFDPTPATKVLFTEQGAFRVFGGPGGLGGDLERLVDLLASDAEAATALRDADLNFEFTVDPGFPRVLVRCLGDLSADRERPWPTLLYGPRLDGDARALLDHPAWRFMAASPATARIVRKTVLDMPVFDVLAGLWAKAAAYETAASLAGEAADAPDQPEEEDSNSTKGQQQSHRNRKGRNAQSRESRSGQSRFSPNRSDPNERDRQNSVGASGP